ncbi:MAG: hypothetical protein ACTHOJ_09805 [Sphingomonas oligoaromativorans]
MATQVKLSIAQGAHYLDDITVGAGTTIAGSDAMELNIDVTKMRKADALALLGKLGEKIMAADWPMT